MHRCRMRGFSLVELLVSLVIVLILTAIALPSLTYSYRTYQLNDSATRLASMLKFTRFEAIRLNRLVPCQIVQNGTDWLVWADSNKNGTADPGEMQFLMTGGVATLLPAGAPPAPGPILGAIGANTLTVASGANGSILFDHRGAVSPLVAYVMYIGSITDPEFGYRAVVLLPSGITQLWTAPNGGVWQRVS
jgi:prepilin-type N-terminal cleavage/methylation domain-containing protein